METNNRTENDCRNCNDEVIKAHQDCVNPATIKPSNGANDYSNCSSYQADDNHDFNGALCSAHCKRKVIAAQIILTKWVIPQAKVLTRQEIQGRTARERNRTAGGAKSRKISNFVLPPTAI